MKKTFLSFIKNNIHILLLIIIGLALYMKSISFGYTHHDDTILILKNLPFLNNFSNILTSFKVSVFYHLNSQDNFYRPIFTISLILDTIFSNIYPNIYHLTNIIIHVLNSLVLYSFLIKFKIKRDFSFLLTLLFSIHPVMVQAVSWIPGRNDSLLFLFVLLYCISLLKLFELKKNNYKYACYIFYFLALFTKETAIVLLPLTVLYKILFIKNNNKKLLFVSIGNLMITVIWYFLRKNALKYPVEYPFWETINFFIKNIPGIFIYLGKFFMPIKLSTITVLKNYPIIYGVVAFILLIVLIIRSKGKDIKKVLFGTIFFASFFLPTFFGANPDVVFTFLEHRIYVPALGILIIISQIDFLKEISFKKTSNIFIILVISVLFMVLNLNHQENFRNRVSFWENAVDTSFSNATSHWGLGMAYYSNKLLEDAEKEYITAIELNPTQLNIRNNLGLVYLDSGRLKEAEKIFEEEMYLKEYPDVLYNYGLVKYRLGDRLSAERYWIKVLDFDPNYPKALKDLYIFNKESFNIINAEYYRKELVERAIEF
ncbi:MAG: tetratricopeptide repeat protein [Patescibacteria group bacterium]